MGDFTVHGQVEGLVVFFFCVFFFQAELAASVSLRLHSNAQHSPDNSPLLVKVSADGTRY